MRTGTYESRGLRLSYQEAGEGLPLLLLHAFPLSGRMWDPQVEALASAHRIIVPDLSGFGASGFSASKPGPETSRMTDFATDAGALLDHLGIDRAVVGGLSMGGYAALAFAEIFPDRLLGLVLANTRAAADTPEAREKRLATARDVLEKGSGILAPSVEKLLGATTRSQQPELVRQVGQWISGAPPAGVAAAQRGMAERPDRSGLLPRIAARTLVIVGDEDELIPQEESRGMAEAIPDSELAVFHRVGHLSSLEAHADFNEILRSFLSRLP
ncbi:MAG TPA: alpha/beta fold hydrolase [Thermoanaerobaculia bacterium]|nr:alpha/beta fold hydrolase [Thermoanaerobaculia bacterium]